MLLKWKFKMIVVSGQFCSGMPPLIFWIVLFIYMIWITIIDILIILVISNKFINLDAAAFEKCGIIWLLFMCIGHAAPMDMHNCIVQKTKISWGLQLRWHVVIFHEHWTEFDFFFFKLNIVMFTDKFGNAMSIVKSDVGSNIAVRSFLCFHL